MNPAKPRETGKKEWSGLRSSSLAILGCKKSEYSDILCAQNWVPAA